MTSHDSPQIPNPSHAAFLTTRWSMVLVAQGKPDSSTGDAADALEKLCRQYWPPLYAYLRHRDYTSHDAQDLTQEFFARLLAKHWLNAVDPARGRFRSFLLMALQRFLANEWDRSQARKRGGGMVLLSLDAATTDALDAAAAAVTLPAESLYERRWALTLLESVMTRLKGEYTTAGRSSDYELLKPHLTSERGAVPYESLAVALRMEPASARSAVHRLRKRFREIFREEVAGTVADPADVDDEMRAVIAALGHE